MIQTVNVNVAAQPTSGGPESFLVLSQNENGRQIRFRILGDDLPAGCTATFSGTKPDGNVYSASGTIDGNFVLLDEEIQMTAVAGRWDAKLLIAKGAENIMTSLIRVTVMADAVSGDAIPSSSELDGIVAECRSYAEAAKNEAYGSPLTASTAAAMTDTGRVYVYTGSESGMTAGHWYYYNGSAWADGGVYNAVAVNTDTTLTIAGKAADAKEVGDQLADVKEDLSNVITAASQLSSYTYYPFGTYTTGLRLNPTTGETYSGGANNFVFDDYIAIPKGRIYFESKAGYVCNIVFYDVNKHIVDTMADDVHMVNLFGKYYDNSTAAYMRVGVYCANGASGSEHCYAYTFNEKANKLMPLWLNTDANQASLRNNRMACDYMYADEPVMVVNNDPTKLIFGVILYDESKTQLKIYYVADVRTVNYVNIPKGHYFRIYTDPPTSQQISPTDEYVGVIEVKKAKVGFLNLVFNDKWFGLTASVVGLIDMAYAEKDTLVSCADYGTTYNYKVALYASDGDVKPVLVQDSIYKDFIIPKGCYYRIAVKRVSGTVTLSDYDTAITVTELPINTENTKGVASAVGKTRMQLNPDSMPSYYTSHMASKIDTINGLKSENTIQFAFITDYHFGTYQSSNNARCLLTEIVKNTPVNMVFNGGDTWTRGTGSSSYGQAKKRLLNGVDATTPNAPCNWFFAIGNHDTGLDYSTSGGTTTTYGPEFTTPELQKIMGGNVTGYDMVFDPASNLLAYWLDVDDFRFIVSNVGMGTVGSDEAHANVKLFFAEALASMGNRTGIVVSHAYYSSSGGSNSQTAELAAMIVAYNARSTYAVNTVGNVDFANCTGEVAMWISGHTHKDLSETLSDGTPIICTTTANAGGELGGLDRTLGTVNENAFDIITVDTVNKTVNATRIGAGSDREFDY